MKNLKQFVASVLENDGATFNINTGIAPTEGYVVADGKNEVLVRGALGRPDGEIRLGESVRNFILDNADSFSLEGNFIGGWVDGGAIVLDVVQVVEARKDAVLLGLRRNQQAIYDLNEGKDIALPSKRQNTGTDAQKDAYIKLLARQVVDGLK